MIVESTNLVHNLEVDLMPFMKELEKQSNFPITMESPWIVEAD